MPATVSCPVCHASVATGSKNCTVCGASLPVTLPGLPDSPESGADPAELVPGVGIDSKYQVLERLGSGGFGDVFRGRHLMLHRDQALKTLHPFLAVDPGMRERFFREARVLMDLMHPNLIAVRDVGQWRSLLYMVMDLCPGETLTSILEKRRKIPGPEAIQLLLPVLRALEHAHAKGVIHRDLKPANLMVFRNEKFEVEVKVLDFGIAKLLDRAGLKDDESQVNTAGLQMGTPQYMSPEQAQGLEMDARTDLYSLGVILYTMVTGAHPFRGKTPAEIMKKLLLDPMPPFSSQGAEDEPRGLEAVVARLLAKKPEGRPASARELAESLEKLLADPPVAPGATASPTPRVASQPDLAPASALAVDPSPEPVGRDRFSSGPAPRKVEPAPVSVRVAPPPTTPTNRARFQEDPPTLPPPLEPEPAPVPVAVPGASTKSRPRLRPEPASATAAPAGGDAGPGATPAVESTPHARSSGSDTSFSRAKPPTSVGQASPVRPASKPVFTPIRPRRSGTLVGAFLALAALGLTVAWSQGWRPVLPIPPEPRNGTGTGEDPRVSAERDRLRKAEEAAYAASCEAAARLRQAEAPTLAPGDVGSVRAEGLVYRGKNRAGLEEYLHEKSGLELVLLPAGEYSMGSHDGDPEHDVDETRHKVTLRAFLISQTEVTNAQFRGFRSTHCSGTGLSAEFDRGEYPAVLMTWHLAHEYCTWAGLRLPTEAEWEYAAQAGDGRLLPWGLDWPPPEGVENLADATARRVVDLPEVIEGYEDGCGRTTVAGRFPPNPFGLHDLAGNVQEWCSDFYGAYPPGDALNPRGPATGQDRVVRGGCWASGSRFLLRCARRQRYAPEVKSHRIGFRPAMSVPAQ